MEKLELYNLGRNVPEEARKPISAGRLKGFTDINPMWRIKRLTEMFGPCGIGWWYTITDKRLETGSENEVRAFVDIELYYSYNGETSHAVPGTGGSSFVTVERNGTYVSDECFKMALTDAISVAAKSLGIGADVYYEKDRDKYTIPEEASDSKPPQHSTKKNSEPTDSPKIPPAAEDGNWYCESCGKAIPKARAKNGKIMLPIDVVQISVKKTGKCLCAECLKNA